MFAKAAVVQLCDSQLLPATVLDRWTAIALLSTLSVPQLFFPPQIMWNSGAKHQPWVEIP